MTLHGTPPPHALLDYIIAHNLEGVCGVIHLPLSQPCTHTNSVFPLLQANNDTEAAGVSLSPYHW